MTTEKDAAGDSTVSGKGFFEKTLWSTILKAKATDEQTRQAALERLLGRYRRPIIRHIQHSQRCDESKAEDLAHEFIQHWIRKEILKDLSPDHGRFRTFIKACINNFLIDYHRKENTGKRKPESGIESLDQLDADDSPVHQLVSPGPGPEWEMDRAWAESVLQSALAELERECQAARRGSVFSTLKSALGGDPEAEAYTVIAAKLGITVENVKITVHRLRKRLGELIREEVKQTVGSEEDAQEELRYLIQLMGKA